MSDDGLNDDRGRPSASGIGDIEVAGLLNPTVLRGGSCVPYRMRRFVDVAVQRRKHGCRAVELFPQPARALSSGSAVDPETYGMAPGLRYPHSEPLPSPVAQQATSDPALCRGPCKGLDASSALSRMRTTAEPYSFTFEQCSYQTHAGSTLLHAVSGSVSSGHVLAVLGPSGAGKTTLLSMLTLERQGGKGTGKITLGGQHFSRRLFTRHCAAVTQHDTHWPYLTGRDHLRLAIDCYRPHLSRELKREAIDMLLESTGLVGCQHTRAGSMSVSGMSSGQRRRLTLALAVAKQPAMIFLDEPTSGLDSAAAANIMAFLQLTARQTNVPILCTVHQPSSAVLARFGNVLILSLGRVVYFGPTSAMSSYLSRVGKPVPPTANPAEFMLDCINADFSDHAIVCTLLDAWHYRPPPPPAHAPPPPALFTAPARRASAAVQFWILARRHATLTKREPMAYSARLGLVLGTNTFISLVYFGTRSRVQEQVLYRFYCFCFTLVAPVAFQCVVVPSTHAELIPVRREIRAGMYAPLPYVAASGALQLGLTLPLACAALLPAYVLTDLGWASFLPAVTVVAAMLLCYECMAQLLGHVPSVLLGMILYLVACLITVLFCGLFIRQDAVHGPSRLLLHLNPMRDGYTALTKLAFEASPPYSGAQPCPPCPIRDRVMGLCAALPPIDQLQCDAHSDRFPRGFYCPGQPIIRCFGSTGAQILQSLRFLYDAADPSFDVPHAVARAMLLALTLKLAHAMVLSARGAAGQPPARPDRPNLATPRLDLAPPRPNRTTRMLNWATRRLTVEPARPDLVPVVDETRVALDDTIRDPTGDKIRDTAGDGMKGPMHGQITPPLGSEIRASAGDGIRDPVVDEIRALAGDGFKAAAGDNDSMAPTGGGKIGFPVVGETMQGCGGDGGAGGCACVEVVGARDPSSVVLGTSFEEGTERAAEGAGRAPELPRAKWGREADLSPRAVPPTRSPTDALRPRFEFAFEDVSYELWASSGCRPAFGVPTWLPLCRPSPARHTVLLQGVGAGVTSGRLLAVLGPSGAGKTTLLSLLTLVRGCGLPRGRVTLNNAPLTPAALSRHCAVVPQHDELWANFSADDHLRYAVAMYSPDLDRRGQEARLALLLDATGLRGCRYTPAGRGRAHGLSSGQRRRLSLALALAKQPAVLFLDEPTSGLDSAAAANIMAFLRLTAQTMNVAILCTVHQPSASVFAGFDDVLVLAAGRPAYFGPAADMGRYLESVGRSVPANANPAEAMLDLVNQDFTDTGAVRALLDEWSRRASPRPTPPPGRMPPAARRAGFMSQLAMLCRRHARLTVRAPLLYASRAILNAGTMVFFGCIYLDARNPVQAQVLNKAFFYFWIVAIPSSFSILAVYALGVELRVVLREVRNGMYTPTAFVAATSLLQPPMLLLVCLCGLLPAYAIIGPWGSFPPVLLVCAANLWAVECIAQLLSLVASPISGMLQCLALWVCSLLFNGLTIQGADIPWPIRAFHYVLPLKWALSTAVYQVAIHCPDYSGTIACDAGRDALCPSGGFRCVGTPDDPLGVVCFGHNSTQIMASLHHYFPTFSESDTTRRDLALILLIGGICKALFAVLLCRRCRLGAQPHMPEPKREPV